MRPEVTTVDVLLAKGEVRLAACGIESAHLDAELLLAHALQIDRARRAARLSAGGRPGAVVPEREAAVFRGLVKRRALREPIAYILGSKEFWSLDLEVTPAVLIPRPETEVLVREALVHLPPPGTPLNVVDVGTGSGAIAIALARERGDIMVLAIDISAEALEVAKRNAKRHRVESRVYLMQGDLLLGVLDHEERFPPFQMVVSNPPYVGLRERGSLMPEVRDHEPAGALYAGYDGTEAIERLVPQAERILDPGGSLLLEVAAQRAFQTVRLLEGSGLWQDVAVVPDLAGLPRVVRARRSGKRKT